MTGAIDLFWEPAPGEKVRWKKTALGLRSGIAGCDGTYTVVGDGGTVSYKDASYRMFWIRADGPVTYRTDTKGRRHEIRPSSQTPACLEDIEPVKDEGLSA